MRSLPGTGRMCVIVLDDYQLTLRRIRVHEEGFVGELMASEQANLAASRLEPKAHALVRLGILVALDAGPSSYAECVESARLAGASLDEIVGVLVTAIPVAGLPRVVSAAPKLSLGLGYDLDA